MSSERGGSSAGVSRCARHFISWSVALFFLRQTLNRGGTQNVTRRHASEGAGMAISKPRGKVGYIFGAGACIRYSLPYLCAVH